MSIQPPRRFLPSLPLLTAFEAAARSGSITQAANELSLTQSAVSRQIKALEEQLGIELFVRQKQKIRLTLGGQNYAREIRDALSKISNASLKLRANPTGNTLTIGVPPTFGARWLTPRLGDFYRQHPEISLNILSRLQMVDFHDDVIDASIYFGLPDSPESHMQLFRREVMVPVCSADFAVCYALAEPGDVRRAPLLHLTSRPDAWERWMRVHRVDDTAVRGMLFDQFSTLIEAAAAGLGIALIPEFLIREEFQNGRLTRALPLSLVPHEAYYLCWPRDRGHQPGLEIFAAWLTEQGHLDASREASHSVTE